MQNNQTIKQQFLRLVDYIMGGGSSGTGAAVTEANSAAILADTNSMDASLTNIDATTGNIETAIGDLNTLVSEGNEQAYDETLDVIKNVTQNPTWNKYTDTEVLATAQDLTSDYVAVGSVIPMRTAGYNSLVLDLDLDVNDATGNMFKFMSCDSDGANGRDIYNMPEETLDDADSGQTFVYENVFVNYIQLYAKYTAISGTLIASNVSVQISKSYN